MEALEARFRKIDKILKSIEESQFVLDPLLGSAKGQKSPVTLPPAAAPEPLSEEDLAKQVAKKIAEERLARGWRQQDLADATGIARPNIARLESGRRVPKISTLQRIGHALGLPIDELINS